jgi:5-(carboxyamino)imidazole ribonucleotide synthase
VTAILPGATIGFLGGGQLGRMAAMAARSLGYDVRVLDPDPACPARAVATRTITAAFDDVGAAEELARECDVLTLEIEQIAAAGLDAAARYAPVRPGRAAVYVVQDRARQKDWLRATGFPVGPYRTVTTEAELVAAVGALGPCIAKTTTGGYDGRGQVRIARAEEAPAAWAALGGRRCVVERLLALESEVSVLVARRPGGESALFPPAFNHHDRGVLTWSMTPAPIPPALAARALELGRGIAAALDVVGLLAVEMFVVRDGDGATLLVNELAPRPHNTFHATERACETSQFEQLVRAVCDLPLGATGLVRPGAIVNLLGDLWRDGEPPPFTRALEVPGVRLHLYGKASARAGRKMGHLSALGDTAESARDAVLEAFARL